MTDEHEQINQDDPIELTEVAQLQTVAEAKQLFNALQDKISELDKKVEALRIPEPKMDQPKVYPDAALSLGSIPGNAQLSLSPEALIAMDDDDFKKYWNKVMR